MTRYSDDRQEIISGLSRTSVRIILPRTYRYKRRVKEIDMHTITLYIIKKHTFTIIFKI
jgi:hypothetical protein